MSKTLEDLELGLEDLELEMTIRKHYNVNDLIVKNGEIIMWVGEDTQPTIAEVSEKVIHYSNMKQIILAKNYIEKILNDKAKSFGFGSILSARSYTGYPNAFQETALNLAKWSAEVWAYAAKQSEQGTDLGGALANLPTLKD